MFYREEKLSRFRQILLAITGSSQVLHSRTNSCFLNVFDMRNNY